MRSAASRAYDRPAAARRPGARIGRRRPGAAVVLPIAVFAVFAVSWEAVAGAMRSLLFPTFLQTIGATAGLIVDPEFLRALVLSNQAFVLGFVIAVVAGIPVGLMMARFPTLERAINPYLDIVLTTPTAAIIPFLILFVGTDLVMRTTVIVLFSIPYVIVNARAGVRQVDPSLVEMGTSFGATERQLWRRVLLPGAMPAVMTGVRIGLSRAFTGMVIVELLGAGAGIGVLILRYQGLFRPAEMYGVVLLMILEALVLVQIVVRIERRLVPWAPSALSTR